MSLILQNPLTARPTTSHPTVLVCHPTPVCRDAPFGAWYKPVAYATFSEQSTGIVSLVPIVAVDRAKMSVALVAVDVFIMSFKKSPAAPILRVFVLGWQTTPLSTTLLLTVGARGLGAAMLFLLMSLAAGIAIVSSSEEYSGIFHRIVVRTMRQNVDVFFPLPRRVQYTFSKTFHCEYVDIVGFKAGAIDQFSLSL